MPHHAGADRVLVDVKQQPNLFPKAKVSDHDSTGLDSNLPGRRTRSQMSSSHICIWTVGAQGVKVRRTYSSQVV
ncbi:hypothetical protein PAAG_11284 [Paracoccidioides lutzii Pb01]|uniref:Uncharacterized protein n=1 Tax=Paracoccidioides lutzii (strain ATCC MYA-826 / Pb01) TaxID=502779 RepID=A0A0A2VM03_PARBA|nr:hypothetical protein PAAG_11284 [Paracoccidioides lutzii Pb01]KGQ01894.1 hypothetical protein PAAG_11284 [Paracoccidioides lutzii Pb01]